MKRDYEQGQSDDAVFFFGKEVEHTPVYGKKTLFVVGVQSVESIEKMLSDPFLSMGETVEHIFFGANHSFKPQGYESWKAWEDMITYFLTKNYWCSLDIPMTAVNEFHDGGLCDFTNFIPQIRVPIPYVRLWNYNTMIKIDDIGFNQTNPGVWTHSLHTLMDPDKFTNWSKYKNDKVIK
jgi:hypothetical protein